MPDELESPVVHFERFPRWVFDGERWVEDGEPVEVPTVSLPSRVAVLRDGKTVAIDRRQGHAVLNWLFRLVEGCYAAAIALCATVLVFPYPSMWALAFETAVIGALYAMK